MEKPCVVVVLGATGVGKSRLAIDLACKFGGEVINADSMQVYKGLDILTNKVPCEERRGIPHHLLGVVEPNEEFSARQFRDLAIAVIDDLVQRGKLPIVVGGTNYYIQALISTYLLDDYVNESPMVCHEKEEGDKACMSNDNDGFVRKEFATLVSESQDTTVLVDPCVPSMDCDWHEFLASKEGSSNPYEELKLIDEEALQSVHPNNKRKLNQLISLYKRTGRRPSELLDKDKREKWGTPSTFRYDCCFLCLDGELSVVDKYVEQRVDTMVQMGLLNEVAEFYAPDSDFTRGLRQAIGISAFSSVFSKLPCQIEDPCTSEATPGGSTPKGSMEAFSSSRERGELSETISEAVKKMKSDTRRLVRIQRRRFNQLETQFGWHLHRINVTDVLSDSGCLGNDLWTRQVVSPSAILVEQFLKQPSAKLEMSRPSGDPAQSHKQFICEVCGSRVFIGLHQWQEHTKARAHRKRVGRVKKLASCPKGKDAQGKSSGHGCPQP